VTQALAHGSFGSFDLRSQILAALRRDPGNLQYHLLAQGAGEIRPAVGGDGESAESADHGLLIGLDQPWPACGAEPAVLEDGERVDGDSGGNRRVARQRRRMVAAVVGIVTGDVDDAPGRLTGAGLEHLDRKVNRVADG